MALAEAGKNRSRQGGLTARPAQVLRPMTGPTAGTENGGRTPVLLADEQSLLRAGLRSLLCEDGRVAVVGEAGNGLEAIALARQRRPAVLVADIALTGPPLTEVVTRLLRDELPAPVPVLVLGNPDASDDHLVDLLRAGVRGFLYKKGELGEVVHAIQRIAVGEAVLAPLVTRRLLDVVQRLSPGTARDPSALDRLTRREREVLALIAKGWSNTRIACELSLHEATVKSHVYHLRQKLNLEDRAQAVVFAYQHGVTSGRL